MPVNLMHITDLHLNAQGRPEEIDDKAGAGDEDVAGRAMENFLTALERFLTEHADLAPTYLLITGDIVSRGGSEEDWDAARGFLLELANVLQLPRTQILVVPGNHDVSWSGTTRTAMFGPFLKACKGFTLPRANQHMAFETEVVHHGASPKIDFALLASPSFGTHTAKNQGYFSRIASLLQGLPPADRRAAIAAVTKAQGQLDFAAIGNLQLHGIRALGTRPDDVLRVALMHHHLLPDPQIEITPFEAVIDAGETLETLLGSGFNLVLSGHKHHKRLVTYAEPETGRQLHVFSGPSLFETTGPSPRGFTMIEVDPPGTNAYATLRSFQFVRREIRPGGRDIHLTREDVIAPAVRRVLGDLGTVAQEERLLPVLEGYAEAQQWTADATLDMARWAFDREWTQIVADATALARREIILRPPEMKDAWDHLVASVSRLHQDHGPHPLRLVSEGDIAYWEDALNRPHSQPGLYMAPLDAHPDKTRILLLDTDALELASNRALQERVLAVVRAMEARGYEVKIADPTNVDPRWRDYGILGDVAVSRFESRHGSVRALRESFARDEVEAAKAAWNELTGQYIRWHSSATFAAELDL